MEKSTHSPHYEALKKRLVDLRKSFGLSQRALAERLDVPRSFVSRIELGERRIDLVELYWICQALGVDPLDISMQLVKTFRKIDRGASPS